MARHPLLTAEIYVYHCPEAPAAHRWRGMFSDRRFCVFFDGETRDAAYQRAVDWSTEQARSAELAWEKRREAARKAREAKERRKNARDKKDIKARQGGDGA